MLSSATVVLLSKLTHHLLKSTRWLVLSSRFLHHALGLYRADSPEEGQQQLEEKARTQTKIRTWPVKKTREQPSAYP